jgi:glutaminyl-peptide cyclotransferase
VDNINELECVDGKVYANIWQTDTIVRIDPQTGAVTGEIDASGLLTESEEQTADVLNGIARAPEDGTFFVTGKLWPHLFRVRFVPAS